MRPAQLRRFAQYDQCSHRRNRDRFNEAGAAAPVCPKRPDSGTVVLKVASMRPAQLRRFANPLLRPRFHVGIASMRPAQLRRFACAEIELTEDKSCELQ